MDPRSFVRLLGFTSFMAHHLLCLSHDYYHVESMTEVTMWHFIEKE